MQKPNLPSKAKFLLIALAMALLPIWLVVNGGWVPKDGMSLTNLMHR